MNTRYCFVLLCTLVPALRAQWGPARRFVENGSAQPAPTWSISSSFGGMVHVVWSDTRNGEPDVYYERSTDYGETWEKEVLFAGTGSAAENPGVAIAGVMNPIVHVVWDDDRDGNKEIYYKRSSDWGITWSEDTRLTDAPGASVQPNLHGCVCCGADVRIVWVDERDGNPDIYYKYSDDNGITWSKDILITSDGSPQERPNLSFCRADVQAVWIDHRSGKPEIWGSHSVDCGVTWSSATRLSSEEHAWAGYPVIAHVDSTYHVIWTAKADPSDPSGNGVFYRRTDDLGLSWSPISRVVTHDGPRLPIASCFAMKKNVHLVWSVPEQGLYYMRSTDNGTTWEDTVGLTVAGGTREPCVAISGTCVHVVWYEKHAGGADICYIRDPAGNPVGGSE